MPTLHHVACTCTTGGVAKDMFLTCVRLELSNWGQFGCLGPSEDLPELFLGKPRPYSWHDIEKGMKAAEL